MIFDKIRFVGAQNVDLPIVGATPAGPFILKGVDGLGPPEREVSISRTIKEGGVRQGTRAANRQVVALVGLRPNWSTGQTSADLRDMLYGLLTTKYNLPVKMQLMLGSTVVAQAKGDISKIEPSLFTKSTEAQITLDCDYPALLAPNILYQVPTKTVISGETAIDVVNDGTAPAGFWMSLKFLATPTIPLKLTDDSPNDIETMRINGDWKTNDVITIDTRDGSRGIWRERPTGTGGALGPPISKVGNLTGGSIWLQMHGGANRFMLNHTNFSFVNDAFGHTPAYWGV